MKISIKVKTRAKSAKIEKNGEEYVIYVKEEPIENKANMAIIKLLAKYFGIPKSHISIYTGLKSKRKIIEIL